MSHKLTEEVRYPEPKMKKGKSRRDEHTVAILPLVGEQLAKTCPQLQETETVRLLEKRSKGCLKIQTDEVYKVRTLRLYTSN